MRRVDRMHLYFIDYYYIVLIIILY